MARTPLTPSSSRFGLLGENDPFLSLHREMNRHFDDVLRGTGLPADGGSQGSVGNVIHACMNVSATDKEIRITAELLGVARQDIDVSLDDGVLTVTLPKAAQQERSRRIQVQGRGTGRQGAQCAPSGAASSSGQGSEGRVPGNTAGGSST